MFIGYFRIPHPTNLRLPPWTAATLAVPSEALARAMTRRAMPKWCRRRASVLVLEASQTPYVAKARGK